MVQQLYVDPGELHKECLVAGAGWSVRLPLMSKQLLYPRVQIGRTLDHTAYSAEKSSMSWISLAIMSRDRAVNWGS